MWKLSGEWSTIMAISVGCRPQGRALVIKDYILDTQQVEAERVFLVKPEDVLSSETAEGLTPNRVVLGLK